MIPPTWENQFFMCFVRVRSNVHIQRREVENIDNYFHFRKIFTCSIKKFRIAT